LDWILQEDEEKGCFNDLVETEQYCLCHSIMLWMFILINN